MVQVLLFVIPTIISQKDIFSYCPSNHFDYHLDAPAPIFEVLPVPLDPRRLHDPEGGPDEVLGKDGAGGVCQDLGVRPRPEVAEGVAIEIWDFMIGWEAGSAHG